MADGVTISLSIIVIIAVILNVGTCYILLRTPNKNQYIIICIHIAISDLMQSLLGYVPELFFDVKVSGALCKGTTFCVMFSALSSISLLTLMSILKVVGIKMPFRNERWSRNKYFTHGVTAVAWFYAFLWSLPPLVGWSKYTVEATGRRCSLDWGAKTTAGKCYLWMLIVFSFIVPVSFNIAAFKVSGNAIGRFKKRCKRTYGSRNSVTSDAKEREVRGHWSHVFMLASLVICWSPYAVIGVISGHIKVPVWLLNVAAILAKSSAMFNPLIYCRRAKWKLARGSFREMLNNLLIVPGAVNIQLDQVPGNKISVRSTNTTNDAAQSPQP